MEGIEWQELSGKGRLHTFTVIRQAADPWFQQRVPYVYGVVELDEGPRMISGIQCEVEDAVCDMPVEAVFEDLNDDWTIVQFKPSQASSATPSRRPLQLQREPPRRGRLFASTGRASGCGDSS